VADILEGVDRDSVEGLGGTRVLHRVRILLNSLSMCVETHTNGT